MKKDSIISTTLSVSIIVVFSKMIGFLREAVIAAFYGANANTDAYFLAQSMPAMIFPAVCSSISTAFLSLYVNKTITEGEEFGDKFASKAIIVSIFIGIILGGIGILVIPYVVPIFAPGFDLPTREHAIALSRITMSSFILTMIQYMLTAVLNSKKFFRGAQIAGVLHNIFVIIVTVSFGKNQTMGFLTWTSIGGLLIQIIVLISMTRNRFRFTFSYEVINKDIVSMFRLTIPILIGNSIVQINTIVDKALASNLTEGGVSALSYSNSLNSIVTSVFIISLSMVLYPTLAENASKNNNEHFSKNLIENLKILIIIIVPISIITVIYAYDIVSFVFERGTFTSKATQLTSDALTYYAIGYTFIAIREVNIRGFYAQGDSKTPMVNGIISVGLNIILSIILAKYMGISGIALGTSISAVISAILMLISMKKRMRYINISNILPTAFKVSLAAIVTSIILHIFSKIVPSSIPVLRFSLATVLGFLVYFIILIILKCEVVFGLIKLITKRDN